MRGSPDFRAPRHPKRRSIPACAGKPRAQPHPNPVVWVHPRVCGGASQLDQCRVNLCGPSPRVRGSPAHGALDHPQPRSIPACAGEPRSTPRRAGRRRVHPRVCGGAEQGRQRWMHAQGPSPRVRGSPVRRVVCAYAGGSIPACAGEPMRTSQTGYGDRVHPRVCGGARRCAGRPPPGRGPSPRVRGSLRLALSWLVADGSIPASPQSPASC